MRLSQLFADTPYELIGADVDIVEIRYDSRKVQPGDLFVCIVGSISDGHQYAEKAAAAGAAALVVERRLPVDLPQILVYNSRVAMAEAARVFFDHPADQMTMVGVTGTNGKTTVTHMIKQIAEAAGHTVGMIGTIHNMIGTEIIETERTTPESIDLHRVLAHMVEQGVGLCVMEVSSHALDQFRVHGINYSVAVFTNLTQDHLDYHHTIDNYRAAKKKLFRQAQSAVVNIDDAQGAYMLEGFAGTSATIGIRESAEISAKEIDITPQGVQFDMILSDGEILHSRLNIPGLFSVYNALCAAGAATALSIDSSFIKAGLESISSVSGRLENLTPDDGSFTVLLDYAHTPDALENVLKTVREFARGRIVTLFGCGGGRDRAKRPIMGQIAGRYSDFCIISSDNPRNEDPMDIIEMVESGMKMSGCEYTIIENRYEAIRYAIEQAQNHDVILLAGKGHETYQEIAGVKKHFDEKEIVSELLQAKPRN